MPTNEKIGNAEWGLSMDEIFLTVSDIQIESDHPISLQDVFVQWDRRLILSTPKPKYTKEIYDLIRKNEDAALEIDFGKAGRSDILYVNDLKKAKLGVRDIDLTSSCTLNRESFWKYCPPLTSTKVRFVTINPDKEEMKRLKQGQKMLLKDVVYNLKVYPLLPELSGVHKNDLIVTNLDKIKWVDEKGIVSLEDCYFWKSVDRPIWGDTPYSLNIAKDSLENLKKVSCLRGEEMAFIYGYFIPPVRWIPYFLYSDNPSDLLKKVKISNLHMASFLRMEDLGYIFDLRACTFSIEEEK